MRKSILWHFLVLMLPTSILCQKIDHMVSFRDMQSERYFRFNYDNDFFAAADRNYTQGYALEFVLPVLQKNPVNFLFFKPKDVTFRYGMALEHIGFTPDDYVSPSIQFEDRPFASALMLKSFVIGTDTMRRARLSQSFSMGIIGPWAFGEEMQVGIHRAIGDKIPGGWPNQIANDVVVNYRLAYEKRLFRFRNAISLQADTAVQLGTLFTNASFGMNTTIGLLDDTFGPKSGTTKFSAYLFVRPLVHVVGYDATLQGGVFNRRSPYTIATADIERFTASLEYGAILKTGTLYFEYTRASSTREFETGSSAKWGGIKIGFGF
ncbi:lipid A deacylase LpxR family protein [Aggregatimonas sangjinii]|uniref:Lipid A deacylase LpxR family protein n=1 Tax=Aggregatimonas sangjinii TaxID=2583587 RepID=A0A5B7SUF3_9FLAO|nr:lipid A deacylase LpxR family protein [Aggregatimonas sangjinii]QCX00783.1 lipid A deacylase LpxR family protein [Aggregatimonas sangjinii]